MNKSRTLLIELYVEEFPVKFLLTVLDQMPEIVKNVLAEKKINFKDVEVYVTPTRIVIYVGSVSEFTQKVETEVIGPNINIGIKGGEYTDAAKGFAKKNSVEIKDLYIKHTQKGDFLAIKKSFGGEQVKNVLPGIVKTLFTKNIFSKTMVWEETKFKFPRPIRNILVFFGNEVIKTNFAGIKSSDTTFGIKTFPIKKIKIKGKPSKPVSENYFETMENENILVNHKKRLETLKEMLEDITNKKKLFYDQDKDLLEEINMLIEYPSCVICEFPQHFLSLPKEVVKICMKTKQKFVPLFDIKGNLTNNFIGIKNGCSEYLTNVKTGYEKVLTARLSDAKFFYETDLKTSFENRVKLLEKIVYNYKIGSMYSDKIIRIKLMSEYLNRQAYFNFVPEIIEKTSKIIKNDITTLVVQEYPELQGTMGKLYSLSQGIDINIAEVCEQHYLPKQFKDPVPKNRLSVLFAIATKLSDIIDNAFAEELPSGTSDPFGLKKVCDGLIKILFDLKLDLCLEDVIGYYTKNCGISCTEKINLDFDIVNKRVIDFIKQRLENVYVSMGYKIDEIRSVLYNFNGNFWSITKCLESINKNRSNKEFKEMVEIYKRINNILRQGKQKYEIQNKDIDKSLLKLKEELDLIDNLNTTKLKINILYEQKDFKKIVQEIISLKPVINNFFDNVLVFDSDDKIAVNRLLILEEVFKIFGYIGQLDLIQQ